MECERLVAVGGYFDGKLMAPTAVGMPTLRVPIHKPLAIAALRVDDPVPVKSEIRVEDYYRGEFTTQEKVFAVWIAKDLTYANVMERLIERYTYER